MKKKYSLFIVLVIFSVNLFAQSGALYFDGVDDYIVVPGNSKLNSLNQITLETWLYSDNFNTSPCADCAPIIWNQGKAYRFGTGNGKLVYFSLQNGTSAVTISSSKQLAQGTWHHIAGTYDGAKMRIYIDGVATDSNSSAFAITYNSSTDNVWIADPQTGWGGILEETRIWDYARSKKEIQESMVKRYATGSKGLVLQYSYEDGAPYKNNTSVSTIKDYSSNKNDGTPTNFKLTDTVSNFVLGRTYCDTVVYSKFSASQCVKYTLPSKKRTVTSSGTYNDTIISYQGCDSVITIKVTILNPTSGSVNIAACDSFRNPYNGNIYKKTGKYSGTTRNVAGCDSVVTFNVTIYKKDSSVFQYNACNSVMLKNGKKVIYSGRYVDSLKGAKGCDSFVIHRVTISRTSYAQQTLSVCTFVLCPSNFKKVFTTPGIYYDTLLNKANCDSIIEYTVVTAKSYGTLTAKTCSPYKSPSNKYTYTQSGTYSDTLMGSNQKGCDSIITINLTFYVPAKQNLKITDCNSYTVPSGKRVITVTQTVIDIIKSKNGCDSIEYTIDVTINKPNTSITRSGNTLSAATTNGSAQFQWLDCDVNYSIISGETNKQFSPKKNGNYALEVKENSCVDTSGSIAFTLAGIKNLLTQQIVVSSNPSKGSFAIRSTNTLLNVKVSLYDTKGRIIKIWDMQSLQEQDFYLETSSGLYYLKIEASEGFKVLPLIFE
jgi:hypothetical protein